MEQNKFEGLYIIGYGLAGGFGGQQNFEVIQAKDLDEAENAAWESACEEYERYDGMHGLRSVDQIMQEEDLSEEDAVFAYEEERESWLDYSAIPYSKQAEEKVRYKHYHNPFSELTDNN